MRNLHTEIEIDASPEIVWNLLTDFPDLPRWNPFMQRASGTLQEGERLAVFLQPPGGMGMNFKPTLLKVDPPHELRWLGHLLFPGLFDGEHYFQIEPLGPGRVRLRHGENFKGILVPLLLSMIGQNTRRGFEAMNAALKAEAEKRFDSQAF